MSFATMPSSRTAWSSHNNNPVAAKQHMHQSTTSPARLPRRFFCAICVLLCLTGIGVWQAWPYLSARQPLLTLAPMVGGLDDCLQNTPGASLPASCLGPTGSAAPLVEATLARLGEVKSPALTMGYTLKAPLLDFLRADGTDWKVDADAVQRLANTIRDVHKPVVLYLFSTHFESGAPAEQALASDPTNLAYSPKGPLPVDSYYGTQIYPWSVARTDNDISRRRQQVIEAISEAMCRLPDEAQERILGVTLLGEVHQLFPKFQSGMGFTEHYEVSDYSPASIAGFRDYLVQRFGKVETLNAALGSTFTDWNSVSPPDRNIRQEPLQHYWQHIDSFAHGTLPVSGWVAPAADTRAGLGTVHIYLNGQLLGRTPVGLGRQDVLDTVPELGSADLGWRQDLDFSSLPTGIHQLDMYLERGNQPLTHLGSRRISVMDSRQSTPTAMPMKKLPVAQEAPATLRHYIDSPIEASSYFYNPLVPLWHAYRNAQVAHYLEHFGRIVHQSCLAKRPLYTHQLIPFSNPSWDAQKYAVDTSLHPMKGLHLGLSLYGESSYGSSFMHWLQGTRHTSYGVTEFHPLKAMPPHELAETLERHRLRGARFVSMFLDGRVNDKHSSSALSIFSFDPDNTRFGSGTLYESLKSVLASPQPLQDVP